MKANLKQTLERISIDEGPFAEPELPYRSCSESKKRRGWNCNAG